MNRVVLVPKPKHPVKRALFWDSMGARFPPEMAPVKIPAGASEAARMSQVKGAGRLRRAAAMVRPRKLDSTVNDADNNGPVPGSTAVLIPISNPSRAESIATAAKSAVGSAETTASILVGEVKGGASSI
eukprot:scaffold370_cov176-Amphora_coffeaeformis.AAC.16